MIICDAPDGDFGAAIRISAFVDCQARALGENGFQAFVGGPMMASLLSGLVTIFVALIGYRFLLDRAPSLNHGVGLTIRLGLVLALITSWPAFQTLVYRVAVDAPGEVAGITLPSTGLPASGLEARVQAAYDTMRLGWSTETQVQQPTSEGASRAAGASEATQQQPPVATRNVGIGQAPLPQTASLFVMSTIGVVSAFKLAVGFLLAAAPLAILALLFDATLGLFSGWVRALAGAALATLAATIVTAVELIVIEGELASAQAYGRGGVVDAIDTQALTTITLSFLLIALITVAAAVRMASAFRLPRPARDGSMTQTSSTVGSLITSRSEAPARVMSARTNSESAAPSRVAVVTDALSTTLRREQAAIAGGEAGSPARSRLIVEATTSRLSDTSRSPIGVAGRRASARGTRSAMRRDRSA